MKKVVLFLTLIFSVILPVDAVTLTDCVEKAIQTHDAFEEAGFTTEAANYHANKAYEACENGGNYTYSLLIKTE